MSEYPEGALSTPQPCTHLQPGETCSKCGVRLFSICGALEQTDLIRLDRLATHISVPARTSLFQQGEPAGHVYNVIAGTIRLFKLLPDGRRQIVGFAIPGDFLGLSLEETNAFGAEVIDDADLCQFDRIQMTQFADTNQQLMHRLYEFVSHELVIAQEQMVLLGRLHAEERVATFLLSMYERFNKIGRKSITIPLPMLRADIADYLGLTVETVSRTISYMGRQKILLVVPAGVRILDMDRLKAIAS
jgi:CRP/FNR family transcriptional regulator